MHSAITTLLLLVHAPLSPVGDERATDVPVRLDQEQRAGERLLNPSTQSVNRYHSALRELGRIDAALDEESGLLTLRLRGDGGGAGVRVEGLDVRQLVPRLPYFHGGWLDAFDRVNLMLAEYARNGVSLAHQRDNARFARFEVDAGAFEQGPQYRVTSEGIAPNPRLLPKRLSVTNNCLDPGLWELSASDSVGEMYHGWLTLPPEFYAGLVRRANGLSTPDEELLAALAYDEHPEDVPAHLARLRKPVGRRWILPAELAKDARLGGYSSQDSRRKVQQGYFWLERDGQRLDAERFGDLRGGDRFVLRAFVPPGIYTEENLETIPFTPEWDRAEIAEVEPRTRYAENRPTFGELGHLEVTITSGDGERAVVVGNVPTALLVLQEDYPVPAFGAGVLSSSELIERRTLRLTEGPAPHYAYLLSLEDGRRTVLNNHEHGLEQIFLRPFRRDGQMFLRVNLVSYERIVDLAVVEIPLPEELAARIERASAAYQPPSFRVYSDSNTL